MKISFSLKLALIFLVFAVLYIIFSDKITLSVSKNDLQLYNQLQTYKGIVFVVLSSLLIYAVSARMTRDIDKAHKDQQDLLERYNVLGMATNDGIWDLNLVTGECFTNRTLQDMFGYSAEELSDNKSWWTLNLHPDDKRRVVDSMDLKLTEGATVWQDEYRFKCKDGTYKWIFDRGYIMREKSGLPYRLVGAMQDVTEQRNLQQQLLTEQLRHKNEMASSVISAQEAERKKLGEELHDNITQLLSVIKLYIENAKGDPSNQDELLKKSSEYLVQVIDEIKALSRALIPPMIRDIDLVDAIKAIASHIRLATNMNIKIESEGFDESILSDASKLMMYRVIQEKINNILNHAAATEIYILLCTSDNKIKAIIKDNGKGFDPSNVKAGIGLNSIRNRVESVNGQMALESAPGKGCTLTIQFDA